jgi:hypothetical protein
MSNRNAAPIDAQHLTRHEAMYADDGVSIAAAVHGAAKAEAH